MKAIKKINLIIPVLILLAGIVSFTYPSAAKKQTTPAVVFNVANFNDTTDLGTDPQDVEEFVRLYEELESKYQLDQEFVALFYPAVVASVRLTVAASRTVVAATRALTRNTPVIQQVGQGLGQLVTNLLGFLRGDNAFTKSVLDQNMESYQMYCLR